MERLSRWKVGLFCTDNWGVYSEVIAADKLYQSKSQTVYFEQDNGRQRHWFARFRRKSLVVSKTLEIVDLTMELFASFHVNGRLTPSKKQLIPLLQKMGIKLPLNEAIDFPVGSMFWARSAALKPLLDLQLGFEDFEDTNPRQRDGTLAHALSAALCSVVAKRDIFGESQPFYKKLGTTSYHEYSLKNKTKINL